MSKQIIMSLAFFLILFSLFVFPEMSALAFDVRGGEKVAIVSGEVVNDDLYIAGELEERNEG